MTGPVDGDYALDKLKNTEKGRKYFFADPEDLQRLKAYGAEIVRRTEDGSGTVPAFDGGGAKGSPIEIRGGLTLMSMSEAQHKAYTAPSQKEADERKEDLEVQARASGGEYTTRVQ